MTFIDWSDREEMIGLLLEYVSDERNESAGDEERAGFLDNVAQELAVAGDTVSSVSTDQTIQMLRLIADSQPRAFAGDEVMTHLQACIEELERINLQGLR